MLILRKKFLSDMTIKFVPEIADYKFFIEEIICRPAFPSVLFPLVIGQ